MIKFQTATGLFFILAWAGIAPAQHLYWHAPHATAYTALYGEIEVLASGPTIYFCGCNWWPGSPAGGYTGIQEKDDAKRNMIFSIWDTSDVLHPAVVEAHPQAKFSRFGGEGTGAHTDMPLGWQLHKTYRYYVTKEQDRTKTRTLTRLYFENVEQHRWVHQATISNPNDGHESVTTFGGMLNSFLENWSGKGKNIPKIALYRLWVGRSPMDLESVTQASGDGIWGTMNGSFYLAEGDSALLATIFAANLGAGQERVPGKTGQPLAVKSMKIDPAIRRALTHLPRSPLVPAG